MTAVDNDTVLIDAQGVSKHFVLHNQGAARLDVLDDVHLQVRRGECLVLNGASGTGKSTLLRSLYANYLPQAGRIRVRHDGGWVDMVTADAHRVLDVRRRTMGYVSQFLRVIPRVSTIDIVSEPLRRLGVEAEEARGRSEALLERLNIPSRLWALAPGTFSGGEQQRVNIAHCFVADYPILLLDEPTASLDAENRQVVIGLIRDALARGCAMAGIFHDAEVRIAVGTHAFDMNSGELHPVGGLAA